MKLKLIYTLLLVFLTQGALSADYTITPHQSIEAYDAQGKVDRVLFLMQKRLAVMHEVARSKWNKKLPIEDKVRELQILQDTAKKTSQYQIDEAWATRFFQAQFEAAKTIQSRDFEIWKRENAAPFASTLDLKDDIRPYLDNLTTELIAALSDVYPLLHDPQITSNILPYPPYSRPTDQVDESVWKDAIAPLQP